MTARPASTTPVTTASDTAPAEESVPEEALLVGEELLVEDVSIDGMCGVY